MSEPVRIYVNGQPVDARSGATILEAVERHEAADGAALRQGEKIITDSRGLPADPAGIVYSGAIFRLVRARSEDSKES